jgi:predicted transcriptional regulator
MSDLKQEAIDLIERLPDGVTTSDIIEELYFKWQVDEGLRDALEGRTLTHEELKERMARWRTSAGR